MRICPICNGLREVFLRCASCKEPMIESGRVMDFYDDYSPYMEIEVMKMEDGYPATHSSQKCPHLFHCATCQQDQIIFINE